MDQTKCYLYLTFPSVHQGLSLESMLKEQGTPFTVVPTPRDISECCGICIRFTEEWRETILKIVQEHGVQINGVYRRDINPNFKKSTKFV